MYIYIYVRIYVYVGRLAFAAKLWRCQRQSRSQPAFACGGPAGLAHLWPRLMASLVLPHSHAPDTQTHTNTHTHTPTPKNGYTHMFITKQNLDTGHVHTYTRTRAHTREHAHIHAHATRSRKIWNGVERIHACILAHTPSRMHTSTMNAQRMLDMDAILTQTNTCLRTHTCKTHIHAHDARKHAKRTHTHMYQPRTRTRA